MIRVWIADAEGARVGTLEEAHRVVRDHGGNVWIDDLDCAHSECRSWLEVDAEIVEKDRLPRVDIQRVAGELVEADLGLADTHETRFGHVIEH